MDTCWPLCAASSMLTLAPCRSHMIKAWAQAPSITRPAICRAIAEAVGKNVGVPVEGVLLEDAYTKQIWPDWVTSLFALNQRADSTKAQKLLKWDSFKSTDMLSDIASGSYAAEK